MDKDRWNDQGLIDSAAPVIRELVAGGRSQAEVARIFGVSRQAIHQVLNGQTRRHDALLSEAVNRGG